MQCIPSNNVLKYHPDTMITLRKKYNLDKPGDMDNAIDILNDWIQKQDHFKRKDFPREYLERIIILLKGSVERAKSQLEKICTIRTIMPNFFEKYDVKNDFPEIKGYISQSFLPNLTEDHYRVFIARFTPEGPHNAQKYFMVFLSCVMYIEFMKTYDYCDGIIAVADLRGINIIEFTAEINLIELRQMATISMEGYGTRLKGIHILSTSNTIGLLVKIFKQVVSEKIGNRVKVHKNVEELYEFISKELLPKDYGGNEKSLDELSDDLINAVGSEENVKVLKNMWQARTDESLRSTAHFNDQYLGVAGTFRTLNVD